MSRLVVKSWTSEFLPFYIRLSRALRTGYKSARAHLQPEGSFAQGRTMQRAWSRIREQ